ncbi:MAG: GDP-mannose 4,6-dehydratase [Bacilli bacterium]
MTVMGNRVLVTGAGGFVGVHLAAALRRVGYEVVEHTLGAHADSAAGFSANAAESADAAAGAQAIAPGLSPSRVACDLRDGTAVLDMMRDVLPDAVIHLAAQSSVAESWNRPGETMAANVAGTANLLGAVRSVAPRCRVLTIGSAEEYASPPSGSEEFDSAVEALDEDSPCMPANPYALSKYAVWLLTRQFHEAYALPVIHARPFNHIGPGQRVGFVVTDFAEQLAAISRAEREPVLSVGNLEAVRDFTDVRDIVRAYVALLRGGRAGEVYNVCSGQGLSVRALLDMMVAVSGLRADIRVDAEKFRPVEVPALVGNAAKIHRELGWRPELSLRETLADVLQGFGCRGV